MVLELKMKYRSVDLSLQQQKKLDSFLNYMSGYGSCKIRIAAHGASSYGAQQESWDYMEAVKRYLMKKGVMEYWFLVSYGEEGDPLTVELSATQDDGPSVLPCPNPCKSLLLPKNKRCIDKQGNFIY